MTLARIVHACDSHARPIFWCIDEYENLLKLQQATGDPTTTAAAAETALVHVQELLTAEESSSENYMHLDRTRRLREALHQLVGTEPLSGLALEMAWRRVALKRMLAAADASRQPEGPR